MPISTSLLLSQLAKSVDTIVSVLHINAAPGRVITNFRHDGRNSHFPTFAANPILLFCWCVACAMFWGHNITCDNSLGHVAQGTYVFGFQRLVTVGIDQHHALALKQEFQVISHWSP